MHVLNRMGPVHLLQLLFQLQPLQSLQLMFLLEYMGYEYDHSFPNGFKLSILMTSVIWF